MSGGLKEHSLEIILDGSPDKSSVLPGRWIPFTMEQVTQFIGRAGLYTAKYYRCSIRKAYLRDLADVCGAAAVAIKFSSTVRAAACGDETHRVKFRG